MAELDVEELRGHLDDNEDFRNAFRGDVASLLDGYGVAPSQDLLDNLTITRDKTGEHQDAEDLRNTLRTNSALRLEFQALVTRLCRENNIAVTHDLMSHLNVAKNCPVTGGGGGL